MFFILSKTFGILTVPSKVITIMAAVGLILLLTRFARAGRRVLVVTLALFLTLGFLPVGKVLVVVLEQRFPPWNVAGDPPRGIIVLGGAIDPDLSAERGAVSINGAAERLTETAKLARRFPDARIVFSGGNPALMFAGPPESAFVLDLFETMGVPRSRVTLEERSRNTAENAQFTRLLVDPRPGERWLLVTSAMHMPRAVGTFRKAGFPVEAYPVDWATRGWDGAWRPQLWPLGGVGWADGAAKEWVGLVAYWLAGQTSELLPGPLPEPSDCCGKPPAR